MNAVTFERIVNRARRQQLILTKQSVQRLDAIYRNAASDVKAKLIRYAGTGKLQEAYQVALLADIGRILDDAQQGYSDLLGIAMLGAAQISCNQQGDVVKELFVNQVLQEALDGLVANITKTAKLPGVGEINVAFGKVAEHAVNAEYARVYRDGLTLSDRLWKLSSLTRQEMENTIVQAIAQQKSARELARELEKYLTDKGTDNARYNALRLARTEINTAHREGMIQSCLDSDGQLKPYITGFRWNLSASHPAPDICDVWAAQDLHGLGSGVYLPDSVPVDHPHGLCYITQQLKDGPELPIAVEPNPDAVPDTEYARYDVDAPAWRKTLQQVEPDLRYLDYERAYAVQPDGSIAVTKDGGKDFIHFSRAEREALTGSYFTHNHPNGTSFSLEDVQFAIAHNLQKIRTVSPNGKYSITQPAKGWQKGNWGSIIKTSYTKHNNAVYSEFSKAIDERRMSRTVAEALHGHEVWSRVADETGLLYWRERWPGQIL